MSFSKTPQFNNPANFKYTQNHNGNHQIWKNQYILNRAGNYVFVIPSNILLGLHEVQFQYGPLDRILFPIYIYTVEV